jgi:uncharacterized protein YbbK (DUF523 family)
MREPAAWLVASELGIVQMPCPELACLGLDRQADPRLDATIESEDTRVAARMNEAPAREVCERLAAEVAQQVGEYTRHGFEVVGILGINGSPTCGLETNWRDGAEPAGPGVFILALMGRLEAEGLAIPFRGVKASDPAHAVSAACEMATRPNFTGVWEADLARSVLRGPRPARILSKIEHREPHLVQELVADGRCAVFRYETTGQETANSLSGAAATSRARWHGRELVIESWLETPGRRLRFENHWSLSADGRTLTMAHRDDDLVGQVVIFTAV